jgi:hypothetical protein
MEAQYYGFFDKNTYKASSIADMLLKEGTTYRKARKYQKILKRLSSELDQKVRLIRRNITATLDLDEEKVTKEVVHREDPLYL